MEKRILSVGDCVLDVLCSPLPDLPEGDCQKSIDMPKFAPGGNSLNFAIACCMVHPNVSFMGSTGEDISGDILRGIVSRYPLRTEFLKDPDSGTATTIALPDTSGGRRLLSYSGANHTFITRPEKIQLDEITHLHRGGYWFTRSMMGERDRCLMGAARDAGVETSMDPATDPEGFSPKRTGSLLDLLEYVDILFLNETELKFISGKDDPESGIECLLERGAGSVFLHRGPRGALWRGKLGSGSMKAFAVQRLLNPTGCGDVFNGVLIGLLRSGQDVPIAVKNAQKASAIHLGSPNVAYPSNSDIDSFQGVMSDID